MSVLSYDVVSSFYWFPLTAGVLTLSQVVRCVSYKVWRSENIDVINSLKYKWLNIAQTEACLVLRPSCKLLFPMLENPCNGTCRPSAIRFMNVRTTQADSMNRQDGLSRPFFV